MNKSKFFQQSGVGAVALLIILSLIAGSVVLLKKTNPKPITSLPNVPTSEVAVAKDPVLSFVTDPATVGPGQNFNLVIKVNPNGDKFHAFELYAKYDTANTDFQIQNNLSQNISSAYSLIISEVDANNQTISIVGTRTGSSFTGSEEQEIARVKMQRKSDSSGDMLFTWGEKTKLGNKIPFQKLEGKF